MRTLTGDMKHTLSRIAAHGDQMPWIAVGRRYFALYLTPSITISVEESDTVRMHINGVPFLDMDCDGLASLIYEKAEQAALRLACVALVSCLPHGVDGRNG
jgi:hypothetical protein